MKRKEVSAREGSAGKGKRSAPDAIVTACSTDAARERGRNEGAVVAVDCVLLARAPLDRIEGVGVGNTRVAAGHGCMNWKDGKNAAGIVEIRARTLRTTDS